MTIKPMSLEDQKFMAFEGLLAWTKCVIGQSSKTSVSQIGSLVEDFTARRDGVHAFTSERHFFIIAAYKLIEYRRWVGRLGLVPNEVFKEIDQYERDVDILRDMNEHIVEYFRGKWSRPQDWVHTTDDAITDASATVGTRMGNRLDWVKFGEAAKRLLSHLNEIDPSFKTKQQQ